jgi:hypothetical protein
LRRAQTVALVLGLVVIFFVVGPLVGGGKESQLEKRAGGAEGRGLINWLASPGGNLLWDVILLALGIFLTVGILQRYFEHREEMRWHPARQYLYFSLFSEVNWLIGLLPNEYREGRPRAWYQFLDKNYGTDYLDRSFAERLWHLDPSVLYGGVRQFADRPDLLDGFEQGLDNTLEHSAAVFLAREPDFNRLIGALREWITRFRGSLEVYREARKTGWDPAAFAGSSAIQQAGINLRELIIQGYLLRQWLIAHADSVRIEGSGG